MCQQVNLLSNTQVSDFWLHRACGVHRFPEVGIRVRKQPLLKDRLLLLRVRFPVGLQTARLSERFLTEFAFVRFLPSMGSDVHLQIAWMCEWFSARAALVRPFPSMNPRVYFETPQLGECLLAIRALVRFFTSMYSEVYLQIVYPTEYLLADLALVVATSPVNSLHLPNGLESSQTLWCQRDVTYSGRLTFCLSLSF